MEGRDDDVFDDDGKGEEKIIFSQNWKKIQEPLQQEGYREGVAAGRDETFQRGFDEGYSYGFQVGLSLGFHDAIVRTLQSKLAEISSVPDVSELTAYKNPTRGFCKICTHEGVLLNKTEIESNLEKVVNLPTSTIIEEQKLIFEKVKDDKESLPSYVNITKFLDL